MKLGVRKPSLKKSIKARTTGKLKREIKRSIDPTYGKKGMGWVKNPKKAAYNKAYNKLTIDSTKPVKKNINKNNDSIFWFLVVIVLLILFFI